MNDRITIDVHLDPDWFDRALRADVRDGLTSTPKELPPKWFYDDRGSQLFDEITRLPEYYPTRREKEILDARSADIAKRSGADTLVELGSGTSEKTRWILNAMEDAGTLRSYVPNDVSEQTLRDAAAAIAAEHPSITVHGSVADFTTHLDQIPTHGKRLIAFLGGTIGNFSPAERKAFLADLASSMEPGETFLLGADLVKDIGRLEAAYDDAAGVTAEFNKNVLYVINRELSANFDVDAYSHVARFDLDEEWIEMLLGAHQAQDVRIDGLDLDISFDAGERMRTEISAKFRPERVESELQEAGFDLVEMWTDEAGDYSLTLAVLR